MNNDKMEKNGQSWKDGDEASFNQNSDKILLKEIAFRLKPVFSFVVPHKNIDMLCKAIADISIQKCSLKSHDIECNLSEVYKLNEKLVRVIDLAQQMKVYRAKLKIADMRINLKIMRNDEGFPSKNEIIAQFSSESDKLLEFSSENYISQLEQRIKDLEFKQDFNDLYGDSLKICEFSEYSESEHRAEKLSESAEYFNIKKFSILQSRITLEKEWDAFDNKITKAKYHKKMKKAREKKAKLQEIEVNLRKQNLELEKGKNAVERSKTAFEHQKAKFMGLMSLKINAVKAFIAETSDFMQFSFVSEELSNIDPVLEDASDIDSELSQLQQELKDLESQFKSRSPGQNDHLKGKMEHLKNRINNLKSLKIIKNVSKVNTISTAGSSNSMLMDKALSPRNMKKILSPKSKASPNKFEEFDKPEENETELRRQLRIKELRIKEREEEAFTNEERALKYWERNLDTKTVSENARQALNEFKRFKDKYENRLEFVEKKRLELQETLSEIAKREAELCHLKSSFDGEKSEYERDKQEFVVKVNQLLKTLEKN